MDYNSLSRKELQALCKEHGVKANMTNAAMADALQALGDVVKKIPNLDASAKKKPADAVPSSPLPATACRTTSVQRCTRSMARKGADTDLGVEKSIVLSAQQPADSHSVAQNRRKMAAERSSARKQIIDLVTPVRARSGREPRVDESARVVSTRRSVRLVKEEGEGDLRSEYLHESSKKQSTVRKNLDDKNQSKQNAMQLPSSPVNLPLSSTVSNPKKIEIAENVLLVGDDSLCSGEESDHQVAASARRLGSNQMESQDKMVGVPLLMEIHGFGVVAETVVSEEIGKPYETCETVNEVSVLIPAIEEGTSIGNAEVSGVVEDGDDSGVVAIPVEETGKPSETCENVNEGSLVFSAIEGVSVGNAEAADHVEDDRDASMGPSSAANPVVDDGVLLELPEVCLSPQPLMGAVGSFKTNEEAPVMQIQDSGVNEVSSLVIPAVEEGTSIGNVEASDVVEDDNDASAANLAVDDRVLAELVEEDLVSQPLMDAVANTKEALVDQENEAEAEHTEESSAGEMLLTGLVSHLAAASAADEPPMELVEEEVEVTDLVSSGLLTHAFLLEDNTNEVLEESKRTGAKSLPLTPIYSGKLSASKRVGAKSADKQLSRSNVSKSFMSCCSILDKENMIVGTENVKVTTTANDLGGELMNFSLRKLKGMVKERIDKQNQVKVRTPFERLNENSMQDGSEGAFEIA